ncbi:MAG TPA: hypothetical protein PL034_01870 [Candidatus Paceibacterota bacterium]|jgi:hypothetical protein|nr:hypothetical protein [Candidatus Paceibacterota bacterium]HPK14071.1 hypothetical protein [Candidatus Paceibacterota bacterium]HPR84283.1 hypothetical protein [Candidatus Paceibacterota bacterium]
MSKDFKDIDNEFGETEESQDKDIFKKDLDLDEEIDEGAIDEVFESDDGEDESDDDTEVYDDEDDEWDNNSDEEEDAY